MNASTFSFAFPWLLFSATIFNFGLSYGSFSAGCIESDREALLRFKHELIDPLNRLASWRTVDANCCRWSGIICDNFSGHVVEIHLRSLSEDEYFASDASGQYYEYRRMSTFRGKISPSLLNLKHLKYLDLSNNNFDESLIPKFLGSVKSLRHLDLANAGFGGMIPHQLGNLSNLQYLNLHSVYGTPYVDNLSWISGLSSLQFLDMTFLNLSQATNWLNVINTLPSLRELHFSFCHLPSVPPILNVNFSSLSILDLSGNFFQGPMFDFLQNITSLKALDLSFNDFNSSIPNWLYGFSHLEFLNLRGNDQLQGKISSDIGNMTSLIDLDLSLTKLEGTIPASFQNLCNLKSLILWETKLSQEINDIFEILFACASNGLEFLNLSGCQLSGHLPNNIGQFKHLSRLDLSTNYISGPLPISLGDLTLVKSMSLSQNNLNGTLPVSFGGLRELEEVDLSYNLLEGDVSAVHFSNLSKLQSFRASGNQLRLSVGPNWKPPSHIYEIDLGCWTIGPQFPHWIHSLKYLTSLNLSNSGIASTIPFWFWNMSSNFHYLNISYNQIFGVISNISSIPHRQLLGFSDQLVDLSSNSFQGPLPYMFSNVRALYLSDNSFSGPMSKFLCYKMHEPRYLEVLDLGGNLLSGEMPDCWMKWKHLEVLILRDNKLSGNIPWSIGTLSNLESLHLRKNNLSGKIPLSLQNCTSLSTLDFGENGLEGSIPIWMGETLANMVILNLRSNKFHGHIPKEICLMNSLYILDFADNNLSGTIPKCLNNFSAMASKDDSIGILLEGDASSWPFYESTFIVTKGNMNGYSSILKFVRFLDLSNNKLMGEIPKEITSLQGLQYLNLSQNSLTGKIPSNIGAMESLEAVDFSQNQLFGEIPQSLAELTFLSYLNLSFNNLSGIIPSSTQLQSLSSSSFVGNEELGGLPLKNCSADGATPPTGAETGDDGKESTSFAWFNFYVSIAPGFVVGFWAVLGPLVFNRRWRLLYFSFLDRLWDKIISVVYVHVVRVIRGHGF
ncbi:receptor-like protein EIX2 [Manihot esculenta]|uniref:Uncharacterized protein n=1 Tax=Manihot esculenta TaxID=3983 RepID=A0ACB7GS42_MANES|nr:receptor-like protein EIX2 [Manihot esculenta]KAG8643117.1 hypothetical protein MANES_11G005900v8 [Manihot esculenta]